MKLLFALALGAPLFASTCVPGVQTAAGYPLITAVCDVQWSAYTTSPPTGNEGNAYDIYYITADGLNAANRRPILLSLHGGGFLKTAAANASLWNAYYGQWATNGFVVIVPGYTVNLLYSLAATMNSGDSTATIVFTTQADVGCINALSIAGQTNIQFLVDGNDTVTVTSAIPACDGSNHVVNVTRSNSTSTHASGAPMYIQGVTWPTMGQDIAGLMAFLAHCAPGGTSYNAGTCSGITNVAGDPTQISLFGISAGAQINTLLLAKGKCHTGPTCTFLNNTPSTPGYHEFSDTGWAVVNHITGIPVVGASIADLTGRTMPLSSTYITYDVAMTGVGKPTCTSGYSAVSLTCTTPTAAYTTSLTQDVLTTMQGGGTMPVVSLDQAGTIDADFYTFETLLGAYPGFIYHSYAGLNHGLDYLGINTPATSTAFKEAAADLGINPCTNLMGNSCPAPSAINGAGVF